MENSDINKALYVEESAKGQIIQTNEVEFIYSGNQSNSSRFAYDLVAGMNKSYSGMLRKSNIFGWTLYEISYENGRPTSFKAPAKKKSSISRTSECLDWYWQTFVNGVLVEEVYLYTTCSEEEGPQGGCGCTGGGGGGGNSGPGEANENPCAQAAFLDTSNVFHWFLDQLDSVMNVDQREWTVIQGVDSSLTIPVWQSIRGDSGVHSMAGFTPTIPIGALMHTHFGTGGYNIFSPADLRQLYFLYKDQMTQPGFIFTVQTPYGTYAITVENVADFIAWGDTYLNDTQAYNIFETQISTSLGLYEGAGSVESEAALTHIFNGSTFNQGTGLKLLKNAGNDPGFGNWVPLVYSSITGSATIVICP